MAKGGGSKAALRRERWEALRAARAARFPGARGRIPNFTGAERAAARLAEEPAWRRARVVKCNPDLPQRPVRLAALRAGKRVVVAVPKLAARRPFVLLDPARLAPDELWRASSIGGAAELGRPVGPRALGRIDLVVIGAVAVARDGARLGKGGGYADLEYALLREHGALDARTPVVTTVHPTQVVRSGSIPMAAHDVPLDLFVTPDRTVRCRRTFRRPAGIRWRELAPEKRAAIPALTRSRKS